LNDVWSWRLPGCEVFKGYTVFDVLRYVDRTAPIIGEDDAVIKALVVLKALDVPVLAVVNRRGEVVGVFAGYNVITLLHRVGSTSPMKLWAALYRTPLHDVDWLTLQTETTTSLEDLVTGMRARGWGYAVVHHGETQHLIGVLDVARFLVSYGALERTSLRLLDIATGNVVSVRRDLTLLDLIGVMLRRRVRRVVLEEGDYIITDRGILQYIVSNQALEMLRDNPTKLLETSLDALTPYLKKPEILRGETPISTAFKKLVEKEPYTVLTEERKHILTPWDITKLLEKKQTSQQHISRL
jgi:CBS domain-containing protein